MGYRSSEKVVLARDIDRGTHVTVRSPVRRPSLCACPRWPGRAWLCLALGCFRHPEHCAEGHHLLEFRALTVYRSVHSGVHLPNCVEKEFSEVRLPLAPRSCAIGFLCRRSQAYRCVHKKHNTPRNTTTPPAILWPLGRGYAELRHYGVLRRSLPAVATWHAKRSYDGDIAAVAHSPSSVFLLIRLPRTFVS